MNASRALNLKLLTDRLKIIVHALGYGSAYALGFGVQYFRVGGAVEKSYLKIRYRYGRFAEQNLPPPKAGIDVSAVMRPLIRLPSRLLRST